MDATRFTIDESVLDALPPDKRRLAIRALREMAGGQQNNALWRFDPLDPNGTGTPHIPQHEWLRNWKTPDGRLVKFRLLPGGNRGGKTTTGDLSVIIDAVDREAVPPHLQIYKRWEPPVNVFLVAVSQRAVEKIHLPIFRKWMPKDQIVGNSFDGTKGGYSKEFQTLHLKNGSTISFLTQGMDVEVFQGVPLHILHFDEEPLYDHGQEIFTEGMQRLVDYNGDLRMTFTPLNGMTWVYDVLWRPWEMQQPDKEAAVAGFGEVTFGGFRFPIYGHRVDQDDNPVIDPEGKAAALAMAKNDEERVARKSGRFVSFAGKIFDDFSRTRHVVPDDVVLERIHSGRFQFLLGGLDPGFRHMAAALWVMLDADGVWIGPEVVCQRTVIPEVVKEIQVAGLTYRIPVPVFVADPAIARTDHQTGKTDQQAYADEGLLTRPGNNAVRPGINAIRSLLAGDRFHVMASCETFIEQMGRYRWRTTGRSENDAPEAPVKRDDHTIDAVRYPIMALPIPEVVGAPDQRSKMERLLARDVARAQHASGETPSEYGSGFWE